MRFCLTSDEDLLDEVVNGNKAAFNHLVKRYQRKLYTFVWYMVLDQDLTEDIVQNTLVTVWQKPEHFERAKKVKFRSWLYTIAKHNTIDELRKNTKFSALGEDDFICPLPSPQQAYETDETQQKLYQVLHSLPTLTRAVLELYYFDNKSYQNIAQTLNLSQRQVEYKLNTAKKALAQKIAGGIV